MEIPQNIHAKAQVVIHSERVVDASIRSNRLPRLRIRGTGEFNVLKFEHKHRQKCVIIR